MYCPGIAPPTTLVHELKAGAAPERLDTQIHLAELPGAAVCFLCAVPFGGSRDGLAVRMLAGGSSRAPR